MESFISEELEELEFETPAKKRQKEWEEAFIKYFIKSPGEHCLIYGITGGGKTQLMYWLADLISHLTDETIVWFDIGKNDEAFKLSEIIEKPLKVFVPAGCTIESEDYDFELYECNLNRFGYDIWKNIEKDKTNIISIYPFILDPVLFPDYTVEIFKQLVYLAHTYQLETPMTIFHDEFHRAAPNRDTALHPKQYYTASYIEFNVERLRSLEVRLIVSSHGTKKIRPGIRSCFNWKIYKRIGEETGEDQKKAKRFSPMHQALRTHQCVIWFPWQTFTDRVITPFYGKTNKKIYYRGIFEQ